MLRQGLYVFDTPQQLRRWKKGLKDKVQKHMDKRNIWLHIPARTL
jgi:hypothetical protein